MGTSQSKNQGTYTPRLLATGRSPSLLFPLLGSSTRCDDPPSPPPTPDTPPSPPELKEDDSIAKAAEVVSQYSNPGPYEAAAADGKRLVMLDTWEGFRCDINKQASPFMVVVHSFILGSNLPDGRKHTYSFLTQVADESGLLMARVDPGRGSMDGRIHRGFLGGLAVGKLQLAVTADGQGDQALADVDFGGLTWTGNLKYGSMGSGLIYGCNYWQSVTPKLTMGAEGMYISANQSLLSNYTVKYTMPAKTGEEDTALEQTAPKPKAGPPGVPAADTTGSSTMCINWKPAQAELALNYKRVVTPNRVTLGAELLCNPFSLESQLLLAAEFKLQRSRLHFCVDGGGRLQSLVEAKLGMAPGSPTLSFSADVDHLKEEMKFGYGLNIDG